MVFPDEIEEEEINRLPEGAGFKRLINAYERNHALTNMEPTALYVAFHLAQPMV
jgi:hypothetical protein